MPLLYLLFTLPGVIAGYQVTDTWPFDEQAGGRIVGTGEKEDFDLQYQWLRTLALPPREKRSMVSGRGGGAG